MPCSALAASVVYFEKRKKQFREKNNKAKSSLDQMIESLFPILTTLSTMLSKGWIFLTDPQSQFPINAVHQITYLGSKSIDLYGKDICG